MSRLIKALKNLETRAAEVAPPVPKTAEPPDASQTEAPQAVATAPVAAESVSSPPNHPPGRVRPRRIEQSPVELFAGKPILESLTAEPQPPAACESERASPTRTAAAGQAQQYRLAPAVVVNQAALDAGAELVQEMASSSWDVANQVHSSAFVVDSFIRPAPRQEAQRVQAAPAKTPTLFEHRIRETLAQAPRSRPFAELVERLRQDFRCSEGKSLLFTGIGLASRGDEMLAHVAALFAEQGEKVLLVDADLERGGLTAGLGAGTLGGLRNAITSAASWQDYLLATSFPQLTFLPTGRGNLNVDVAADRLSDLIPQLEQEFPLVLVDGGQSSGAIAGSLARSCEATYLVIRLGATDAKEAQAALRNFRSVGARVMGCVAVTDGV